MPNRLESVPDELITSAQKAQAEVFKELISLLNTLDNAGGNLKLSNKNFAKIEEITAKIEEFLMTETYGSGLTDYAKQFNLQRELINKGFDNLIEQSFQEKAIYQQVMRTAQADAVGLLGRGAVNKEFTIPLKELMNSGIATKMPFAEFTESLRGFIIGIDVDGKLERHVKTIARDAFNIADRRYTKVVGDDLGFTKYRYTGGSVSDSREFCIQRAGKVFTKEEVQAWGNIPQWQGRINGTNSSNIFEFAGGHNCLHQILPVDDSEQVESEK